MFSGGRERVHWERILSFLYELENITLKNLLLKADSLNINENNIHTLAIFVVFYNNCRIL